MHSEINLSEGPLQQNTTTGSGAPLGGHYSPLGHGKAQLWGKRRPSFHYDRQKKEKRWKAWWKPPTNEHAANKMASPSVLQDENEDWSIVLWWSQMVSDSFIHHLEIMGVKMINKLPEPRPWWKREKVPTDSSTPTRSLFGWPPDWGTVRQAGLRWQHHRSPGCWFRAEEGSRMVHPMHIQHSKFILFKKVICIRQTE